MYICYILEKTHLHIQTSCAKMFISDFGWTVPLRAFAATINVSFSIKAGHVCGDNIDLVDGRPTGSVRVSFGYMSTFEDCQRFLNFVTECFVEKPITVDQERLEKLKAATAYCQEKNEDPPIKITNGEIHIVNEEEQRSKGTSLREIDQWESNSHSGDYILTNIYIYPIKSCGAYEVRPFPKPWAHLFPFLFLPVLVCFCAVLFMQVHDWPVGPLGLLHDRGWMVVNENGVCLSQKRVPRLCLIRPQVHLPSNKLLLQASGQTMSVVHWKNIMLCP